MILMKSIGKKAKANLLVIRRDEITSILGGFVLAGGVTLLSLTRLIAK